MFQVLAFPPPRPWWKFWAPKRPYLLERGKECNFNDLTGEAQVYNAKAKNAKGYKYKICDVIDTEIGRRSK